MWFLLLTPFLRMYYSSGGGENGQKRWLSAGKTHDICLCLVQSVSYRASNKPVWPCTKTGYFQNFQFNCSRVAPQYQNVTFTCPPTTLYRKFVIRKICCLCNLNCLQLNVTRVVIWLMDLIKKGFNFKNIQLLGNPT